MKTKTKLLRYKIFKILLLFWTLFIGIGALWGSLCMFIDPTGKLLHMDALLPYFQVLPFADVLFTNYIFSGICLLIVNGLSNILAFTLILLKKKIGYILGTIFGFTLMIWIIIQFIIFPSNPLSTSYFIFGVLQLLSGLLALLTRKQYLYQELQYENTNKSDTLVVYFSRTGYTNNYAIKMSNSNNFDIERLYVNERTDGLLGFLWCGRFGMHKWGMSINSLKHDIKKYKKVIIITPLWVFHISAPIREFIKQNLDYLKSIETQIIINHFMHYLTKCSIKEVESLLPSATITSIETQYGHTHSEKLIK